MSNFKFLVIFVCVLWSGTLFANNFLYITDESEHIYGKGVHAFFDRNYEEAVSILSRVEEIKSEDPRPYYFLGLAYLRQKKTEQADQYFKKAAQLEFSGRTLRDYAVSESLRRIQGEERMRLENIRTEERTSARIKNQRLQEARYGDSNAAAREALRQTLTQVPNVNVAATSQTVDDLGDNVFELKPVEPIGNVEASVVVRRAESAFGGVVANVDEIPPPPVVQTPTRTSEPIAAAPERVFVNVGAGDASTRLETEGEANPDRVLIRGVPVSTDAVRQAGKALGALLSRNTNTN